MGLRLHMLSVHISSSITTTGTLKSRDCNALCTSIYPCGSTKSKEPARRVLKVSSAVLETAASIAVAATVVGAAASILARRNKASETIEVC
ncbi:uncharacterized protein LOC125813426 [Solanum verrucosum]|uniref:uncharacterized protein LOC125813426 n=1 Tax=Solanum verrucosum TaxID=315347 RepID=UPI0020D082A2|nr:uncharacterized protein LOC125813426 [Solanum verrucosum]